MPRTVRVPNQNADFQFLETLRRNREKRSKSGAFFVEGVRPISQALAHGWAFRALAYSDDRPPSKWAREVLDQANAETHYVLPGPLLAGLSDRNEGSELLAVLDIPADDPARIPTPPDLRAVVFDRPGSPGNLGSVIRSIDALGGHGLIVLGHAVDVYDPEVIRASTGSFFAVPVVRLAGAAQLATWLEQVRAGLGPVQLVGASEDGALAASRHDFRRPTVLAMGNETHGLSRALLDLCDATVQIPMTGSASSLNVAAATSILLYELDRQRHN